MASRRTPQDKIDSLLAHYSVRETARRLGVDRRTVQRWKNEGRTPTEQSNARISRVETGVRRADEQAAKRQGFQKPALTVDIPAARQTIPDPRDLSRGISAAEAKRLYSNTVIYDVSRVRDDAIIMELLHAYQKKGPAVPFRFIYRHGKDPAKVKTQSQIRFYVPAAARERLAQGKKNVHISTNFVSLGSREFDSVDGFLRAIEDTRKLGRLMYVVLMDPRLPSPGRGRKRPKNPR